MAKSDTRILIPTPLEIAILLTILVLGLASIFTESSVIDNVNYWGNGMWSLLAFMTQMCLILLGGFVVASSSLVRKLLVGVAQIPQDAYQVYLLTFLVSAISCWLNWGLGLVVGAFFALEVSRQKIKVHFPLVVAVSYMGFIFWHGGLSGSIPLVVGTPGNFSEKWLGTLVHFDQTVFSMFNLFLILLLIFSLSLLIYLFAKKVHSAGKLISISRDKEGKSEDDLREEVSVFSKYSYASLLLLMALYLGHTIYSDGFNFGLNQVNFVLIFLGLALHKNLQGYMATIKKACVKLAPIFVQYPLYAGIMGIMIESGLAVKISDLFVSISSESTYPVFMFLSAGLVNLFVPSGGGQWAVQAPIVIQGAKDLGVPFSKVVMAVAWGDAWTNLAQPFWALPLLSIVGLGIRDILKYCLWALFVSGAVISTAFLVL